MKTTTKDDSFYLRGEKERLAFTEVEHIFENKLSPGWKMYKYITTNEATTHYDVLLHIYDEGGRKVSSNIIEIKIRDKHYTSLLYEQKKHNYLLALFEKESKIFNKVNVFYLNFTPENTYLFDVKNMKHTWSMKKLPSSTVNGGAKWIDKAITYLPLTSGKPFNYIFNYDEVMRRELKDKKLANIMAEQERQMCMFESVKNLK